MRVVFTGGGTLGPVTPLLAIAEAWKEIDDDIEIFWIGTRRGPERELINKLGMKYFHLPVVRFPRYVTVEWLLMPFKAIWALIKAWVLLQRLHPDVIVGAGGFTQVPVMLTGRLQHIPTWIHEQDAAPLLANEAVKWCTNVVTNAWKGDGNPVRPSVLNGSKTRAREAFGLSASLPTVLVFGGGGGAAPVNGMMEEIGSELIKDAQVVHVTGRGKRTDALDQIGERYHVAEFVTTEMADLLAVADVVVARAGMATITELAALSKPAMLVPLPGTQQEANTKQVGDGAIVLSERARPRKFLLTIQELLSDEKKRTQLGRRMHAVLKTNVAKELVNGIKKTLAL